MAYRPDTQKGYSNSHRELCNSPTVQLRLGIAGGGRAAWAYGSAWKRIGWPISGVWLREESRSPLPELVSRPRMTLEGLALDSDLIVIAVSDRAIASVASRLPETAAIVFHASGALPHIGNGFSLHPLRVLPPVGSPSDLENVLLVHEGQHRDLAQTIAAALRARFAEVTTENKPLYHAGAVFGANYVAAVLEIASDLIGRAGVTNGREDLAALALSAVENWLAHTDSRRFTGPAARGDQEVITSHLAALGDHSEVAEIYRLLADQIARSILARQK